MQLLESQHDLNYEGTTPRTYKNPQQAPVGDPTWKLRLMGQTTH